MCECAAPGFPWADVAQLVVSIFGLAFIYWELHQTNALERRRTGHELMNAGTAWELDLEIAKTPRGPRVLECERDRTPLVGDILNDAYQDPVLFALIKVRLNEYEQLAFAIERHHVDPWDAYEGHHLRIKKALTVYEPLIKKHAAAITPPGAQAPDLWTSLTTVAAKFKKIADADERDRHKVCEEQFPAPARFASISQLFGRLTQKPY